MLTTHAEAVRCTIPFWDVARPGELCAVPCWPLDADGDAVDCPASTLLVGVLGEDDLFRAEEEPTFDPTQVGYVCKNCAPDGVAALVVAGWMVQP